MIERLFKGVMGEVDSSPFAPRSKMNFLDVLGAVAGPVVDLAGSVLGYSSNKSANEANIEMQRETNAQNYQIFKENQAWQEDMWNKQNEYNLPANVVERLKAAGINPSAVFGNGSATPAGAVGSVGSPQMQAARVNPFNPDLSGVGEGVNAFFENQLKNKAAQGQGLDNQAKMIDNQYKAMHHVGDLLEQKHRIDKLISDTSKGSEERRYLQEQSEYLGMQIQKFKDTYELSVEREKLQNDVMRNQSDNLIADTTFKRAQAFYQSLLSKYYPRMAQADLDIKSAEFKNILEDTQNKVRDGRLTNAKVTSQYIQNRLQNIDLWHELNKKGRFSADRDIRSTADYFSGLIFDNLKLFGK